MSEVSLDGIESLQITRADGNLALVGGSQAPVEIECSLEPQVKRDGARAEITLLANATIRVPAGVALEVSECAGQLDVEEQIHGAGDGRNPTGSAGMLIALLPGCAGGVIPGEHGCGE